MAASWLDAPKTIAYLSNHAVPPILDYLTAMQLNPQNRGKNIRIEHLLQIAVANLGKSSQTPDISKFKSIIDQEFSFDLMEDLPINMFSEPVVSMEVITHSFLASRPMQQKFSVR